MNMQNTGFDTAAPILSDEQIEAEVFRKLEAAQEAERKRVLSSSNIQTIGRCFSGCALGGMCGRTVQTPMLAAPLLRQNPNQCGLGIGPRQNTSERERPTAPT